MLNGAIKLALLSAFATAAITFYLFPDAFVPSRWINARKYISSLPNSVVLDGPSLGLRISLILVTFFFAQGAFALNTATAKSQRRSAIPASIPYHFLEIPTLLALVIAGVAYIPAGLVRQYVAFLAGFSPLLTVTELCAVMTVIMASGRSWSPKINESSVVVKISVLLVCLISFVASYWVIYTIFATMHVSTLVACLLSCIATLSFSQIVACCCIEHATITDLALMLPYISYNLALIAFREAGKLAFEVAPSDAPFVPRRRLPFVAFTKLFTWALTPSVVVKEALSAIFSPVLVFHLIFQMCILVLASSVESDEDSNDSELTTFGKSLRFCIKTLWPLFGKSFLVLIYTAAWLDQSHPEAFAGLFADGTLPWYLDAVCFWRWFVVFGALGWYGKHLIFDGYRDEYKDVSFKCDKSLWDQLHGFKQ